MRRAALALFLWLAVAPGAQAAPEFSRPLPAYARSIWNLAWVEPGALLRSGAVVVHADHFAGNDPADGPAVSEAIDRLRRDLHVAAIVNLRAETHEDTLSARTLGMPFLQIPIIDGQAPDERQVGTFFAFLHQARARHQIVWWHCAGGIGRTGVLAAMVRLRQGWSAKDAASEMFAMGLSYSQAAEHLPALDAFAAALGKPAYYPPDWTGPRTCARDYRGTAQHLPPWP